MAEKTQFAKVAMKHKATGAVAEGEFICETSDAWQVAVDGKVRLFKKTEWTSAAPKSAASSGSFEDLFGHGGNFFGSR